MSSMSALKTVERAGDLKILERKVDFLTREIAEFINKQSDINREIKQVEQKLSLLNDTQIVNERFEKGGNKNTLQGESLVQFNTLDKSRDFMLEKRKNLSENWDIVSAEIAKGDFVVYDKLEPINKEIALISDEINELVELGEADGEKFSELNDIRDSLLENQETIAKEIADAEFGFSDKIEELDKEIEITSHEIGGLIKGGGINREKEIELLTQTHNSLLEKSESLNGRISESTAKLNDAKQKLFDVKKLGLKKNPLGKSLKSIGGAAKCAVLNTAKSGIKSGFSKVDPFAKGINKDDVADTGAESIRLARQTMSKTVSTVKTTKQTLKTTNRTLKTATKAAVRTAKATYRATAFAVKSTIVAAKVAIKGITHLIAALINPVVLVIIAVLLVVVLISQTVVILMGGAAGGKSITAAYGAAGLDDVPGQYDNGANLLNAAAQNARNGFNALIDAAQYIGNGKLNPPGELANSDLIFLRVRKADGTIADYSTAFAPVWQKNFLKGVAWDDNFPTNEILAIAYVLLQKNENAAKGTTGQIYMVEYTAAVMEQIIALMVEYNSVITHNRPCPDQDCTTVMIPNPAYVALEEQIADLIAQIAVVQGQIDVMEQTIADLTAQITVLDGQIATLTTQIDNLATQISDLAVLISAAYGTPQFDILLGQQAVIITQRNTAITQRNTLTTQRNTLASQRTTIQMGSGALYGQRSSLEWTLSNRQSQLASTPPEIESDPFCNWLHDLHSVELRYFTTERVMNLLNFTTAEKQWVEMTLMGFNANPALP